jgi:hypothetical protein
LERRQDGLGIGQKLILCPEKCIEFSVRMQPDTRLAREGARVVVTARRQELLDRPVAEIVDAGGQAVAVAADVRDFMTGAALLVDGGVSITRS